MKKKKILIWDVETSTIEITLNTYELKNKLRWFPFESIKRDWIMFGAAWKWHGEDAVSCISVSPRNPENDEEVIRRLHEILSQADVLVGHNSDSFDYKKFNTRAIFYGLHPVRPVEAIDTLKISRKYFKFTSNSLRYIAKYLGLEQKDESPDWSKILSGDADELRKMREYNKQDVIVTEQLFNRLMPYHHTAPTLYANARDISGATIHTCPSCGSCDTVKNGFRINRKMTHRIQRNLCKACGAGSSGEKFKI